MGDHWMHNCLVMYMENDACVQAINNEEIMQRFQNMKTSSLKTTK
jgi:hypothetical protein